ncbi:MAG TPA: GNAT family N-acetyltransferase [Negativicutes bacterium]|nr:GNAT family N-acetyltransferase [Negativicutes bacterium]
MQIRSFNELSKEQKRNIYQFITSFEYKGGFESYESMVGFYGGIAFDDGLSHFSLWDGDEPVGTLGAVVREADLRKEIFLTGVSFREAQADKLGLLLDKAFEYCSGFRDMSFKLGLNHDRYYMISAAEENGFRMIYRYLEMNYKGERICLSPEVQKDFYRLEPNTIKDFQRVHNAAFLLAPNGAGIEDGELQEYLDNYSDNDLTGVYYEGGAAAGVYLLKLEGTEGYIEGIGTAPEFFGRGIGKKLLLRSLQVLQEAGAEKIGLSVFDSNTKAFGLYLKSGFEVEKEHSVWLEKKR